MPEDETSSRRVAPQFQKRLLNRPCEAYSKLCLLSPMCTTIRLACP